MGERAVAEFSDAELYGKPLTFMGAPYGQDLSTAKAAILGVPFDCGVNPLRIGSRLGPQAIRLQSQQLRPYNSELADFNPLQRLGVVDCGDVKVVPSRVVDAFDRIEAAARRIHEAGAVAVTMGGDGSVSLPLVRAAARRHRGMVAVHIDAHTDSYPYAPGDKYNTSTQFTHAAQEQLVAASLSYHIGVRGTTYTSGVYDFTRSLGYNVITLRELLKRGIDDVLAELHERLAGRPVYLCVDMDVFDPSVAPGVATPSWGGLLAREGLEFLRGLTGLDIVAVDVNTVSPPHDVQGMTASLAAQVMYEGLVLLCRKLGLD
jgi:agmatinase